MTTSATTTEQCQNAGIDLVRLLFVTQSGAVRSHSVDASKIEAAVTGGVTLSKLVQTYNALGIRDKSGRFDAAGEVRLRPDANTFRALPYAERTGVMCCDIEALDGTEWEVDPRSAVRRFVDELQAEGLSPEVAFESEFHLFERTDDGVRRVDERGAYLTESTRETHALMLDIIDGLKAQEIAVEKYHPEYAAGKHEIVTGHRSGIRAADEHVLLRETIKSIAHEHGCGATFLPKPFDHSTNGCHIHLSLWNDRNVFYDAETDSLSRIGRQFIAGVLDHAAALVALTSPTVNSYGRLRPQIGAAAFVCWGTENREALVRIPAPEPGDNGDSTRLEFRAADNTANPYLALLGLLAAGWDGVERELTLPDSIAMDPGNLSSEELTDRGIEALPRTLGQALDALEDDELLYDRLGPELFETYLEVKRSHWEAFTESGASWERERLRSIY